MIKKLLKSLYIFIPLLVALIITADLLSFYSGIRFDFISYIREFIILGLLIFGYLIIKNRLHYDEHSIHENLRFLTLLILANFLIAILVYIIFDPVYSAGFFFGSTSAIIVSTFFAFIASLTFVPAIFILKQLIFYKRKRNTAIIFHSYIFLITLNAIITFLTRQPVNFQFSSTTLFNDITFSVILLFVIILSFRNEWITHLSRKKKFIYFLLAIPLYAAFASLWDIAYRQSLPPYSMTIAALTYNMWIFLLFYGGLATVKLLLHLPTARAFDRKIRELNSLYDLGRMLNSEIKIEKLKPLITTLTSQTLESHSTWLTLVDQNDNKLAIVSNVNLTPEEVSNNPLFNFDGLNQSIIDKKEAILINDVAHNRTFRDLLTWKKDVRTILGAPLFSNRYQFMGIIYATKRREYTFDIDDASLIQGIANQASIALENAMLLQESIERERLEQELKIARDVQLNLLPQTIPDIPNFDLDAHCLNAYEVGGDYYDFFYFADDKPGVIIGDVSGKGTSAALYMAEFKGIIQTLAKTHSSPYSLACDTNKIIYPNIERKSFVSAIVAKIEPEREEITFARAGHTPVLFCSGNHHNPQNIVTKGIGMGLDAGKKFEDNLELHTLSLKGAGTVVFYTDGVIEARNKEGMEYGEDRLISLVKDCQDISAKEIKETLLNSVVDFCGETPLHDDLTFVILKNCHRLKKNRRKK